MRVLVCPHELVTGGSQLNAIDLAGRLRDRGHLVEVYGPPGELVDLVRQRGLAYRAAPKFRGDSVRPRVLLSMAQEIRRFRPDIIHTYESPPAIAVSTLSLLRSRALVMTVMSMSVPDFLPEGAPLIVGTNRLADIERRAGRRDVSVMEPPIDVEFDAPGNQSLARAGVGVDPDAFVVSVVGRLSSEHEKARGVAAMIRALISTPLPQPVTLLVAGTGDDAAAVEAAAREAAGDERVGVRLLGNVADPRPIYDAADVVFGMGGSALRAMAHAKPLIVQGREGYWRLLSPDTIEEFFANGFFGVGPSGGPSPAEIVRVLMEQPGLRADLAAFGRKTAVDRYSLSAATTMLERVFSAEIARRRRLAGTSRSSIRALARFARFRVATNAPAVRHAYRRLRRLP